MLNYDYSKLKREEEESSVSSEYLYVRFLCHVIRLASLPSIVYPYPVTGLSIVRAVTYANVFPSVPRRTVSRDEK
jgi:hypothetical protein